MYHSYAPQTFAPEPNKHAAKFACIEEADSTKHFLCKNLTGGAIRRQTFGPDVLHLLTCKM